MVQMRYANPVVNRMGEEELRGYQQSRLLRQVRYAYDNSAFYRQRFADIGAEPEDIRSLNLQMLRDLITLADWLREQDGIRFGVLTGSGRVFAAGQDLKELYAGLAAETDGRRFSRHLQLLAQEMMTKLEALEQVTFCALQGSAYGAGAAIALTCDFRVMAEDAVVSLPETRLGMFLTYASLPRLVALVGPSRDQVLPTVTGLIDKLRLADQRALRITKKVATAAAATRVGDIMLTEPDLVEGAMADGTVLERLDEFVNRPKDA